MKTGILRKNRGAESRLDLTIVGYTFRVGKGRHNTSLTVCRLPSFGCIIWRFWMLSKKKGSPTGEGVVRQKGGNADQTCLPIGRLHLPMQNYTACVREQLSIMVINRP